MAARNVRARRTGKPWFAARLCWLLGVGVGLPGGSGGAVLLGRHRPGHLEHALGELPLAGEQLLGEVVGTGHELLGLGQLVSEGQAGRRDRRRDRLDRLGPGLDGIDDGVLALANGVQDLALNLMASGAGISHFFLLEMVCMLTILRALDDLSSAENGGWRRASAVDVVAGRVAKRRVALAADGRRLYLRAGPLHSPVGPALPPSTLDDLRALAPLRRGAMAVLAHFVPGLGTGRVDDAGDVPTAGQHVPPQTAKQPDGLVRGSPRH